MLELRNIASVLIGVPLREAKDGFARAVRLSDFTAIKTGRSTELLRCETPAVARAVAIQQGDLLVAARGAETDILPATEPVFGAFVSLDLYLIRPDVTRVNPGYLLAFLNLPATQAQFKADMQGTSLARLPKEALESIEVPLPPLAFQRNIAELASCFEQEQKYLAQLSGLHSILGRDVIARAIRARAETAHTKRSSK